MAIKRSEQQIGSTDQATLNVQSDVNASFIPSVNTQPLLSVGTNLNFLSSGIGTANDKLEPIIKQLNRISQQVGHIDIVTVDDKLEFPTLIVGSQSVTDSKYYFSSLLVTGTNPRATHTVDGYLSRVEELTQPQQGFGQTNKPRNSDVSILLHDNVLNDKVINILISNLPESAQQDVVPTGFYTLALTEEVTEEVAREIAVLMINNLFMTAIVENNQQLDRAIVVNKDTSWRIDVDLVEDLSNQTGKDVLGHRYARPIMIRSKGTKAQDMGVLGVTSGTETIMESLVCGQIDYKFETTPEHYLHGVRVEAQTKAYPEFVITKFSSTIPSITSFLLSLANSIQIMSKKECSYACQIATKGKPNFFCNMNLVLNTEKSEKGVGEIPNPKSLQPEDCVAALDKMLAVDAGTIMSMKIDPTNTESYLNQIILGLLGNQEQREYFRSLIVNGVKVLTGRNNIDYAGDIIAPIVSKYPIGTRANSSGVVSLDVLNVNEFIGMIKGNELAEILGDMHLARIRPETSCQLNGKTFDSFIGGLKALKVAGLGDARITGMGYKVTFHPDFIVWLVDCINGTGYTPVISAPVTNAHVIERTFSQSPFNLGAKVGVNAMSFGNNFSFVSGGSGFGRAF